MPVAKPSLSVLWSYSEVVCCPAGAEEGKGFTVTAPYQICFSSQPAASPVLTAGTDGPGRRQTVDEVGERLRVNTKIGR